MAPKRKKKGSVEKKKIKLRTLALGFLVGGGALFICLSLFLLSGPCSKEIAHEESFPRAVHKKNQTAQGDREIRNPCRKEAEPALTGKGSESLPRVAIIIDDVGFDVELARSFQELHSPLSLSVLPTAPHSQAIAREAMGKGVEVLLHLPMEPKENSDDSAGSGTLLDKMGEEEFLETLNTHLSKIPGIKGVNNHMGSLLSEREEKMVLIFGELKRRRLFYVDSRTTPQTVACRVAREMKVPVASRSVFLDHELSQEAMKVQWDRCLAMARQQGHAVMIAHPHRETLVFLREHLRDLKLKVRLVRVADIVS